MQIAALQMVSTPEVAANLAAARALIARAAAAGAELVALPEYFCLMGRRDTDKLTIAEDAPQPDGTPAGGPIQQALSQAAAEHGLWLIGGTLPLRLADEAGRPRGDRVTNTTLVFDPSGRVAARYDKIHLFRFDDGTHRHDEAATLQAGSRPVAFTATDRAGGAWRIGLSICYDLRFPELYRRLTHPDHGGPCDLLVCPAAFTYPTGQAHWSLLLRTRAVENQCYVLAPAQGGQHDNGRRTWGHSLVADPWGEVLAEQAEDGSGVVLASLQRERIQQVRRQLPALTHRVLG
jgi:nitrilase